VATSVTANPGKQSDAPHGKPSVKRRGRKSRYVAITLIVLLLGGTAAAMPYAVDRSPQRGELFWPEMVVPQTVSVLEKLDESAPAPTPDGVAAQLNDVMADSDLEDAVLSAAVYDGISQEELFNADAGKVLTPASSTKVATSAAVLAARGPQYRIPTTVVAGAEAGQVVLVAGGDVTLSETGDGFYQGAGSLEDLAAQVLKALKDQPVTSLVLDTSIFDGDVTAQGLGSTDVRDGYTANLTPVMVDGGRIDTHGNGGSALPRHDDPSAEVQAMLADMLGEGESIELSEGTAPEGAEQLGVVYSPTMQSLVDQAMLDSDNLLADALARQVALAKASPASFEDGAQAMIDTLSDLGVSMDGAELHDGSGLSVDNKLSAQILAQITVQAVSGEHPELAGLESALPVAGYSGSLDHRFVDENTAGAGLVRAKTGTLSNVSSLTGIVVDKDGRLLAFSLVLNDRGNQHTAQAALDAVTVALAGCGCR
jgi:D-alanyl-D-alanine carboxypeptidase/D-alanyl-D-alanine-endopeptidase (penicillin-binding protein 4)